MEGIARVLCAVNIGEPGLAAFERALALARVHAAELIVVCAVPWSQSFNTGATERVAYLLNLRAAAEAAGVDVRVDVQHGEAAGIILLHARARQPDLIVLSAAHGNGANGLRVGSVVADALRGATCPTLVVGRHHEFQRLQSLIPSSGERTVLARVVVGRVAVEIVRTARASEADLVIVGTQSRRRLGRWMFGVTGQLLQEAPCPVLAVPTRTPRVRERDEWRPAS